MLSLGAYFLSLSDNFSLLNECIIIFARSIVCIFCNSILVDDLMKHAFFSRNLWSLNVFVSQLLQLHELLENLGSLKGLKIFPF